MKNLAIATVGFVIGVLFSSLVYEKTNNKKSYNGLSEWEYIGSGLNDSDNSVFYVKAYRLGKAIVNENDFYNAFSGKGNYDSIIIWKKNPQK